MALGKDTHTGQSGICDAFGKEVVWWCHKKHRQAHQLNRTSRAPNRSQLRQLNSIGLVVYRCWDAVPIHWDLSENFGLLYDLSVTCKSPRICYAKAH